MIYFLRRSDDGAIKIGTTVNLTRRIKQHRKELRSVELVVLGIVDGGPRDERVLHRRFTALKLGATPICEWFAPAPELVDHIRDTARSWTEADDSPTNITPNAVVVRSRPEWRDWLKRLAEHDRTSMVEAIDRALVDYALKVGFNDKPPQR